MFTKEILYRKNKTKISATPRRQSEGSERGITASNKTGVTTMTPYTNLTDHADQINKPAYLNSIPSCAKLKLIKKHKVLDIACISKSTLHLKMNDGLFPPSIALGDRARAHIEHEVLAVVAAQIQGRNKDEIRSLVSKLVDLRQDLTLGVFA